jgi:molybdopterin-guanine dinucleotide biosynthesis protein A
MSPTGLPIRRAGAASAPLLEASPPLRACLLSGGDSRRMGRDKALLLHPEGGTWLERTLRLLLALQIPVTLFSRHEQHLRIAHALSWDAPGNSETPADPATAATRQGDVVAPARTAAITPLEEPPPWEGPLLALQRLMQRYDGERLLLCPVDMPDLSLAVLQDLLTATAESPGGRIHLAHDGKRLQPLLGVYPSLEPLRSELTAAVQRGERRLQGWLATQAIQTVRLDPKALRNVNHPQDAAAPGAVSRTEREPST